MEESLKLQALEKLNREMSQKHGDVEDSFHNFLCSQEDDEDLFRGILKENKSIKDAVWYVIDRAKTLKKSSNAVMTTDETVFGWVREYFVSDNIQTRKVRGATISTYAPEEKKATPKKVEKKLPSQLRKIKKPKVEEGQLSLFGF